MKLHKLFLLTLLFSAQASMSMEPETFEILPNDILLYISALAQNNAAIHFVNKHCSACITQEKMLCSHPTSLSRRDHINFMVKTAKNYDGDDSLISLGLKTAHQCNHHWQKILPLFTPDDHPSQIAIEICTNNNHRSDIYLEYLQMLIPTIVSVYRGDETAINEYKKEYYSRFTALRIAVSRNDHLAIELLLAQDPSLLNQRPREWMPNDDKEPESLDIATPLECAIDYNNIPLCALLLSFKNIELNSSLKNSNTGLTLLEWIINKCHSLKLVELVLDTLKKRYDQKTYIFLFTPTAITERFKQKEMSIARLLLEEINYTLPGATQPLHLLCEYPFNITDNNSHFITTLCKHPNTNINAQDEYGRTLLFNTIGHSTLATLLLNNGANPTIPETETGITPLMKIITSKSYSSNYEKLAKLMLEKGYPINTQNKHGETALLMAVKQHCSSYEWIEWLLIHGADPNTRDNNGVSAISCTQSLYIAQNNGARNNITQKYFFH